MATLSPLPDCVLSRPARIKSLSIRAFKSFGDDVQIFNFSKGFNLIVGANGSGKSNILDAICFALCAKSSTLRVGNVSELQSTETKEPCEVSLELQIHRIGDKYDFMNLSVRILPNDARQYKVNGKLKSMKEVKDLLKEHRLLLDETSAVVHQSSVTELADKNSALKLASIISAASGAGRWNEEVEIARKELKSTKAGLEEIQENIYLLESGIADDNARLRKLLRTEQLEKEISYVSKQMYRFQMQKLLSIKDATIAKEAKLQSEEAKIQEKTRLIENKRAGLKKHKSSSRACDNHLNTEKIRIMDTKAMREEEILALKDKLKELNLQRNQLDSLELALENFEMEILVLKKRLEEKQGMIERLEVRSKSQGRTFSSHSGLQRYKDELRNNVEAAESKLRNLHIEQESVKTSLQGVERDLLQWEICLQAKKEEQLQALHFKEASDFSAISKLEGKRNQNLEMKRSCEELQTQIQIMNTQLGSLTLEESALPAWPLHSCFTFKRDVEDILKYMNAMNVIAGFMKRVCITETTDAAARLLQLWDESGHASKFYRIWPLDRLKFEDDIRLHKTIQSSYPKGSIILPIDLLQYDHRFRKAINRAFGKYVISLSDDVGRDLVIKNKIWNVTLDGKVNRTGSVSGGWRADENNGYLHIKLRKEEADEELTSLYAEQTSFEKDIKKLEKAALEIETCKARLENICKDILIADVEIKSLRKEASRHRAQLQQCQKWIAFAQNDLETNKKQLDACTEDLDSVTRAQPFKYALEDAKREESSIVEALEKLQFQEEEARAKKFDLAQKVHQIEREEVEHLIESHRTELHCLKENLNQIDSTMERIAQEEKLQAERMILDNEAIDNAQRAIDEMKAEIVKTKKELVQAKKEEEKISDELKELPVSPDDETVELDTIKDVHECAAVKCNLQKMVAELNQLHAEQQGMSLAEQVAIKERAEKLQIFKERRASIIDSIDILLEGIEKTRNQVQEANEVVFQKVRQAFSKSCKYLLPNKLVNLIKVGQYVEDGVKFTFSNISHESNNVPQEWKTSLDELSGGQRTLLSLAFLLMVATSGQSPLYLMDEVDAALDEENQNRVAKLIGNIVSKGSQVICVSHHVSFQQHSDTVIQVTKADGTTKLHQTYAVTQKALQKSSMSSTLL